MAEGTYEYECMRAELLGLDQPDYEEFTQNQQEENERKKAEKEKEDVETMKEIDIENESTARMSGKLEELNSILKRTQTNINRFKVSCGTFTNVIKEKVSSKWTSQSSIEPTDVMGKTSEENENLQGKSDPETERTESAVIEKSQVNDPTKSSRKSDLTKALDKNLSGLDALIDQAENAQYSMAHQNKQMKKFLK